jgi:lactobin A/cerein 7B family class IIb bacteriocin
MNELNLQQVEEVSGGLWQLAVVGGLILGAVIYDNRHNGPLADWWYHATN